MVASRQPVTMAEVTTQRIAAAALSVADERGASGFTMRAVAEVVGVTPMALYHHVEDKAALVALLVDAAISEHPLPPPTGSWRDDLWDMGCWMREITFAHPAVARLRSEHRVWTTSIFPMTERWLSVWQQSGLELDAALLAASASSTAIIGFVEAELNLQELELPDDAQLASFPNARLAFHLERDGAREFELVVRSVIEGVHARLRGQGTGSAAVRRVPTTSRTRRTPLPGPGGAAQARPVNSRKGERRRGT
jgi:AcrR family transcriptional regulator